VGILSLNFRRLNAQADRGERELETSDVSDLKDGKKWFPVMMKKLTWPQEDYQPGFRYTL